MNIEDMIIERQKMTDKRKALLLRAPMLLIDIGSSKMAMFVTRFVERENVGGLAVEVLATIERQTEAVSFGNVDNPERLRQELMSMIESLERQVQTRLDYALVVTAGGEIENYIASGNLRVSEGVVTEAHIAEVMLKTELPELNTGQEIMHALPVGFSLDHQNNLTDPRNMIGAELAVDMHFISIGKNQYSIVKECLKDVGLELLGFSTAPFMSGLAVLTEADQEFGSVVIDFGAMTTSVAVFLKKQLMYVECIEMGGYHVSADLAYGLNVTWSDAERIKARHGGVVATSRDDLDMIEIISKYDGSQQQVARGQIIAMIKPRVEEILEEVLSALEAAGFDYLPSQKIVITGGASQLQGFDLFVEEFLGRRVRLGHNMRLIGAPISQMNGHLSALTGLAINTSAPMDELWDFDVQSFIKTNRFSISGFMKWARDNW